MFYMNLVIFILIQNISYILVFKNSNINKYKLSYSKSNKFNFLFVSGSTIIDWK